MKSIIVVLTISGESKNAILKTNRDNNAQRFTIMQVQMPDGLSSVAFPFRPGDVYNISELLEELSMRNAKGILTITGVYDEDATAKTEITSKLPVIKKVQITVTNTGATLTINGEVQKGLQWVDYLHKGESVTYVAELEGMTTQTETLTVSTSNITKSITLVQ